MSDLLMSMKIIISLGNSLQETYIFALKRASGVTIFAAME